MKAILKINGWEKIEESIHPLAIQKGHLEIVLWPPMDMLVRPNDKIKESDVSGIRVALKMTGYRKGHTPVFEYL